MIRKSIIFLFLLTITALTFGCIQKTAEEAGVKEQKTATTPTPTQPQTVQGDVNSTFSDIESQIRELEELEKSLQVINNMSFQI